MKSLFFIAAAVAVSLSAGVVSAQESGRNKKEKDQEYRHIIVTLNSGEKVDGYIHRGWNVTAFDLRRENYSVKIGIAKKESITGRIKKIAGTRV